MWQRIFLSSIGIGLFIFGAVYLFYLTEREHRNVLSIKATPVLKFPFSGFPKKESQNWTLFITGDVIPVRVVNQKSVTTNDFFWPFIHIAPLMKDADVTLVDLETPLLTHCPVTSEGMKFCGDWQFVSSLVQSGVDVANLANNHSLNYGWEGLSETEEYLKKAGIETIGFSTIEQCNHSVYCSKLLLKTLQFEQNDTLKLGFLGYNAVGQRLDRDIAREEIKRARQEVDVLVVSVHWGKEYERFPTTDTIALDDPKELGKLFVEWGADIVVGNHPHWYQGIEWIGDKVIFYALGNTIFDQEWSPETKVGYLVKLHFDGPLLIKDQLEILPIGIRDYGQAYLLEGGAKEEVLHFLQ